MASKVYIMARVIEMWFLHASPGGVSSARFGQPINDCSQQPDHRSRRKDVFNEGCNIFQGRSCYSLSAQES